MGCRAAERRLVGADYDGAMSQRMALLALLVASVLLHSCDSESSVSSPSVPSVNLENFPAASRPLAARILHDLELDPEAASANGRLGMLLQAHSLYVGAKACLMRAQAIASDDFRWPYYLGIVQAESGKLEAAIDSFQRALTLRKYPAAFLRLGEVLLSLDRLEESEIAFEAALDISPAAPAAYYGLGKVRARQGEGRESIRMLLKACELAPRTGAPHYALAMAYRDAGDLKASRKHLVLGENFERSLPPIDDPAFREVERLRADQYWYQSEGMRLESDGRVEEAIESYETAIELDAEFVQPHVNLVGLLGRLARFEPAEMHYRRALELNSEIEELHNNWGTIQALRNRPQEASASFRRALDINPFSADGHFNLGSMLNQMGRPSEAVEYFVQALEYEPNHRLANFQLGRYRVTEGRIDDAIAHLERTLQGEDEKTPGFLYALADAHLRAGSTKVAIQYAMQALAMAEAMGQVEMEAAIRKDLQSLAAR